MNLAGSKMTEILKSFDSFSYFGDNICKHHFFIDYVFELAAYPRWISVISHNSLFKIDFESIFLIVLLNE